MKKLKIILRSKYFLVIIILLSLFRIISIKKKESIFKSNDNNFICIVENINSNKTILDCGEILESNFINVNLEIGDIVYIKGVLKEYKKSTNFNLFDYKKYQEINGFFYNLEVIDYKVIGHSNDIILNIKNIINNKIKNLKSYKYLKVFLLGDKNEIEDDIIVNLKKAGIIHLLSISGMHINFLITFIEKIFKNSKKRDYLTVFFLYSYYLLIKSVSLFRCLVFYIVKKINKELNIDVNNVSLIIISISIMFIIKPNILYDIGFYYSTILSSSISLYSKRQKKRENKIIKSLLFSCFIFIVSFPLNLYTNFEVNILSIIYNLFFIPFVSIIIFPLSIITVFFPFIDNLLIITLNLFEYLIEFIKNINISFIFVKPSIFVIIMYYLTIIMYFYNRKFIYLFLLIILFHYNYNLIFKSKYIIFLDVGQGDSILLHLENRNILIDTGGNNYSNISKNITIPLLKSLGIRKIDFIVTSHGDYDHMGEAINLVNNFKVEKVIFNCGSFNDLEQELIKVLDKKKIMYYSCIKELNIDNNKLYFLQTKEYDNENDNSNVIYAELDGYKFMFMGDASTTTEREIMSIYNLLDIDVLKVGHHGSKTSSGKEFINEINPKYSIISVGKNNRYGHPNKEVLENLKETKIYRTDIDGSIMLKIRNNNLKIETCTP